MTSTTVTTVAASDGVRDLPWRLTSFGAALAATCAGELSGQVGWDAAAALLFVAGLAAGWRHWLNRASGPVALAVALGALGVGWALAPGPAGFLATAARLSEVVGSVPWRGPPPPCLARPPPC